MPLTFNFCCPQKESLMKKLLLTVAFLFSLFAFSSVSSHALVTCQPIYGGGQSCVTVGSVVINKLVQNPTTKQFVDNLTLNDPRFQPGQAVTFKIDLTNTSNVTINRITLRDIFPQYVSFVSGAGNFDKNTKTLSFEVINLLPNETRVFTIQGKIVDKAQLTSSQGITCVVNEVVATTNDNQMAQDNSQLCIENKVLPAVTKGGLPVFPAPKVTTTPATGPEAVALFGLIPGGALGYLLRRKSFINFKKQGGEK